MRDADTETLPETLPAWPDSVAALLRSVAWSAPIGGALDRRRMPVAPITERTARKHPDFATLLPETMLRVFGADLDNAEKLLLTYPQAENPLVHHLSKGLYIREATMRAGTYALGHRHREAHVNLMLRGRMLLLKDDGAVVEVVAPLLMQAPAGRKMVYVIEDTVWLNIYATALTDLAAIEAEIFDKTEYAVAHEAALASMLKNLCEEDREDFHAALAEHGLTDDDVQPLALNPHDRIEMPAGFPHIRVADSPIHGRGLFTTAPIEAGRVVAPGRRGGKRTPAGVFTNHSKNPNAYCVVYPNGDADIVALTRIAGCRGGSVGEEITIDYRRSPALADLRKALA